MNYHLCRTRDGYLLSPDCMQAPAVARNAHPPISELGTLFGGQMTHRLAARCMYHVARDSFAFFGADDEGYVELDELAQAMETPTPWPANRAVPMSGFAWRARG